MKLRGKTNECSLLSIYLWFHLLLSHKEPIIWHWSRIYCILLEALKPKFPFPRWLQVARQEDNGKLGSLNVIGCNFPEPLFKNKEVFLWKELKVRHWLSIKISSCSQRTVKQVLKIWISPPNAQMHSGHSSRSIILIMSLSIYIIQLRTYNFYSSVSTNTKVK